MARENYLSLLRAMFVILLAIVILVPNLCAAQNVRGLQKHKSWASFILDAPGQGSWVRINTSTTGGSFAFDIGAAGAVALLALPYSSPAIQYYIVANGGSSPHAKMANIPGSIRVDTNRIVPVIYSTTFENGMAWMMVNGLPPSIIIECVRGKTIRMKVDAGGMSYFYNFPLIGFTAAIRHATQLYHSLFGSMMPDSAYF